MENISVMNDKVGTSFLPGDVISRVSADIKIGVGLSQENINIIANKAGVLAFREPNRFWIESKQKRYIPALQEMIIGVVLEKHMEGFKIDIGSAFPASLGWDGFETQSRKNRAQWAPGTIVYGRVLLANKDMEPELEVKAANGKASGFGKLDGGILIKCSLSMCKELLGRDCAVLKYLGKKVPYEIAVGLNGRVWINSESIKHTILVANTIKLSENLPEDEIEKMVAAMVQAAS